VALALAHKGLEAEPVVIDYADRSEVERVSGQPLVPVLVDDGTVVVDSMEIVRYLERRNPDPPLYPADLARREETLVFIDCSTRRGRSHPTRSTTSSRDPSPIMAASRSSPRTWRPRSTASSACSPGATT
jgi:glutathione S-transferase